MGPSRTGADHRQSRLERHQIRGQEPRILVSVADPQDGSRVVIEVRDHGPGISPRNKERIFGQFERAIGADERQTGFGVGLWVVGQIVEAMEGEITVIDAHGGGTIFKVVLPKYLRVNAHD